jgi:hypothetical protein
MLTQRSEMESESHYSVTSEFLVYPNPVSDHLNISSSSPILNFAIYNSAGKLVYTTPNPDEHIQISFQNFATGLYYVIIETDSGIERKKVIKL